MRALHRLPRGRRQCGRPGATLPLSDCVWRAQWRNAIDPDAAPVDLVESDRSFHVAREERPEGRIDPRVDFCLERRVIDMRGFGKTPKPLAPRAQVVIESLARALLEKVGEPSPGLRAGKAWRRRRKISTPTDHIPLCIIVVESGGAVLVCRTPSGSSRRRQQPRDIDDHRRVLVSPAGANHVERLARRALVRACGEDEGLPGGSSDGTGRPDCAQISVARVTDRPTVISRRMPIARSIPGQHRGVCRSSAAARTAYGTRRIVIWATGFCQLRFRPKSPTP